MKNIHVLPTSQPSNLLLCIKSYIEHKDTPAENSDNKGNFRLGFGIYANKVFYQPHHIYITSAEEIKEGDWCYNSITNKIYRKLKGNFAFAYEYKIILTTDPDLIADGVQAIDDEFLGWFVKNPSCEEVEIELFPKFSNNLYGIIIPKEEPKQDEIMERFIANAKQQKTLEEFAEREASLFYEKGSLDWNKYRQVFIEGAKWQQERICDSEIIQRIRASKSDAEARRIIRTI
jgi:hypothetical protein